MWLLFLPISLAVFFGLQRLGASPFAAWFVAVLINVLGLGWIFSEFNGGAIRLNGDFLLTMLAAVLTSLSGPLVQYLRRRQRAAGSGALGTGPSGSAE